MYICVWLIFYSILSIQNLRYASIHIEQIIYFLFIVKKSILKNVASLGFASVDY